MSYPVERLFAVADELKPATPPSDALIAEPLEFFTLAKVANTEERLDSE